MMRTNRHPKRKKTPPTQRRTSWGKTLISALLVVTMSTTSYSPAIAVAANSSASAPATSSETTDSNLTTTATTEASAIAAEAGQSEPSAQSEEPSQGISESSPSAAAPAQDASEELAGPEYDVPAAGDAQGQAAEEGPSASSASSASASASGPSASSASEPSADSASSASASASGSASASAEETSKTIERTLASTSGGSYTVKVTYDENADIPDGSTIEIVEYTQEPNDPNWRSDEAYADRPLPTERFVGGYYLAQRTTVAAKGLGAQDTDYAYFSKFLDVSIVHDGEEIAPQAAVQVTVETNASDVACADGMGLVRMAHDDALAGNAQALQDGRVTGDGKSAQSLGAQNLTYDRDAQTNRSPADDKVVKLQCSTNELGELALVGVAVPKETLWQEDGAMAQVLGPASQGTDRYEIGAAGLEEGEELLGAYAFGISPTREGGTMLWARVVASDGKSAAPAKAASGLFGCKVQDGAMVGDPVQLGAADSVLEFKAEDGVALLRDAAARADREARSQVEQSAAPASADNAHMLEKRIAAAGGGTYVVRVAYGPKDGIPENAALQVRELSGVDYLCHCARVVQTLKADQVMSVRALDIAVIDADGGRVAIADSVDVSISLEGAVVAGNPKVVHFGAEGPEVVASQAPSSADAAAPSDAPTANTVEFAASSFSVYALAYVAKSLELTASDGNTYNVTVSYGADAGIPEGAKLVVKEIRRGDAGFEGYVARAADARGMAAESVSLAKALDISLVNPETGESYQPTKDVNVGIELLGANLGNYEDIGIVHIPDGSAVAPEVVSSNLNGNAVEFTADGFSVYVVTGSNAVPQRTYRFYVWNATLSEYEAYAFQNAKGDTVYAQTVRSGDELVVPQLVDTDGRVFAGWREGHIDGGTVVLEEQPYDFDNIIITEDSAVDLYAVYTSYATVVMHDQYDSASGSFPIAFTRRAELVDDGSAASAKVRIDDLRATYTSSAGEQMGFFGWSRTPVAVPGAANDDAGNPVEVVSWQEGDEDAGFIEVAETTHLYPVFKKINRLSFHSGPTGSGASYIPSTAFFEDDGPTSLEVPTRDGYTFEGWYVGTLSSEAEGENIQYGSPITNADGRLLSSADDGSVYISNGKLMLRDNATLFAKWGNEAVPYKILIWKQKTTDAADAFPKNYDLVRSIAKTAAPNSQVSVDEEYRNLVSNSDYANMLGGYTYARCSDAQTIDAKGYTVLHVYYDLLPEGRTPTEQLHTLKFVDSANPDETAYKSETRAYNAPISAPADPEAAQKGNSGQKVFSFNGWFADPLCSTQVFFSKAAYDAYTGYNQKVLYDTMPDNDLTLYAGWSADWYVVQIDPNYGTFNGTGGTWFWETFDGELVQEYTQVTRDYVPSSSGAYFYVKHDRAYYGYSGDEWDKSESDRETRYTKNPGEATEDTTFEYAPGEYTYAGWYEVHADGTETPYDFSKYVDHSMTLKLHWKKAGTYYLGFDPGEGTLQDDSRTEAVLPDAYADNASIVLGASAAAPEGYTFVGWQVRGADDGRIYTPGQAFTLHADNAIRTSGKEVVHLDAVYVQVDTARVVYDANGGTVNASSFDAGQVPGDAVSSWVGASGMVDAEHQTVTVAGLANNSRFKLSTGEGFTKEGAEFLGWSDKPVCDASAVFYPKTSADTYAVDSAEPATLYAVWGVKATYHLNDASANWGGTGENGAWEAPYAPANGNYTQTVNLGTAIAEPPYVPQATGANSMFRYWSTSATEGNPYDFSQTVTGDLELYAYWNEPIPVPVHAVDASGETLAEKTEWSFTNIVVGSSEISLDAASNRSVPEGYQFAFAAASANLASVSEGDAVTAVKYDTSAREVRVKHAGSSDFTTLESGEAIYFVYYKEKALDIGYMSMDPSGNLKSVSGINGNAPATTGSELLGSYDMAAKVTAPLAWAGGTSGYSYYAYAIGASDPYTANELSLLTDAVSTDGDRPALQVRNTWRGFQYSTDNGASWTSCGYAPKLYVVYYTMRPTVVMFREQTEAPAEHMGTSFTFDYEVTETTTTYDATGVKTGETSKVVYDSKEQGTSYRLKNGEANSAILFYDEVLDTPKGAKTVRAQSITITQAGNVDFTTKVKPEGGAETVGQTYSYTTSGEGGTHNVTFTNAYKSHPVTVHVALVEGDGMHGGIIARDTTRRSSTLADYSFNLALGQSANLLEKLPAKNVFHGDDDTYAFGGILYGNAASAEGAAININSMGVAAVSYEPTGDDGAYALVVKDANGNALGELSEGELYYLYYPMPQIKYVKKDVDGRLVDITGAIRDSSTGVISSSNLVTYGYEPLTMNGLSVEQSERFEIPQTGFVISQEGGKFRMPPILDDGIYERYLSYAMIGAGNSDATSVSALAGASDNLSMNLQVRDNALQYSFDGETWENLPLGGTPTIYAIYTERGYDLQIGKTVDVSQSGENPLFTGATFTVTISSTAITESSYAAEGAQDATIQATPAAGSTPGTITLQVEDGTKVKLKGMGCGDYVITEAGNDNFNLTARAGSIVGGASHAVNVLNNSTILLSLDAEKRVDLTNSPKPICKIGDKVFYTLRSAMDYVDKEIVDRTATIEMLADYIMPAADTMEVYSGCDVTLTTAESGFTGAGRLATVTRTDALAGEPLFTNNGSLQIKNVILEGANVTATAPMIQSAGNLGVDDGALIRHAVNSGNGGAINATAGDVALRGRIEDCKAAVGGAIHYTGTGAISLSGTAAIETCVATAGNGGAIYASAGTVNVLGTSKITGCTAVHGGAVYGDNVTVNVGESGSIVGNTAQEGGAVHIGRGAVNVSETEGVAPPSISENTAMRGNGGAIWIDSGSVSVSGGSIEKNTADAGNGGAVFANAASVAVSGGSITENKAVNGSAVFLGSGSGTFSGGSVSQNEATAGGSVGMGGDSVRLHFSGGVSIIDNTMGTTASNVYLDQDSDMIVNAAGLDSTASIGIYVPDGADGSLFANRGDIGGRFGSYSSADSLSAFKNDRVSGLSVATDASRMKLYWSSPLSVEVRYLSSFNSGFPPAAVGTPKYSNGSYTPAGSNVSFSELGDDLRNNYGMNPGDGAAVYAVTFADDATDYADYLTRLLWDEGTSSWKVQKRNGEREALGDRKLIVYYSLPSYLSIENNTDYALDLASLNVNLGNVDYGVVNSATTPGYGSVFAMNGAIQTALLPLEGNGDGHYVLAGGASVTLMIPGARERSYSMSGVFAGGMQAYRLRIADKKGNLDDSVSGGSVSITGRTLYSNSSTNQIIFGNDRYICKIQDGDEEHPFSTIGDALAFATTKHMTSVTIEMLVDYLMPENDVLEIAEENLSGLEQLELTTAKTGKYVYDGERATISRASGNTKKPLVNILRKETASTEVKIHDIDFDGKSVQGNIDGGAIKTKYCKVHVEDADFENFIANNGGAVFVSYGEQSGQDFKITEGYDTGEIPKRAVAEFKNCKFVNCRSKVTSGDRMGGGAIWTNGRLLDLRSCVFNTCSAGLQAGAVFHRIEMDRNDYSLEPYNKQSLTYAEDCEFTDCVADRNAGGGMESDAFTVTLIRSTFTNCVATDSHGGGFNTYIAQQEGGIGWGKDFDTSVTVKDCSFTGCTAKRDGGGFHSASNTTTVENSSFENCSARYGGAIGLNNGTNGDRQTADAGVIRGVTIKNCSSTNKGGGIFASTKVLTVENYSYTDSSDVEHMVATEISNCTAGDDGGGICHNRTKNDQQASSTRIEGATIRNCDSAWYGGGVYVASRDMIVKDCVVENCIANGSTQYTEGGGGVCLVGNDKASAKADVDHCVIKGNKSAYIGGGLSVLCKYLTIRNGTEIADNTTERAEWGAGAYLANNVTLTVGTDELGATERSDNTTIKDNATTGGVTSNLRLPEKNGGGENDNKVIVLCDLSGYVGVVNAKNVGTQFGTSPHSTGDWRPSGLSDSDAVFNSDSDTLKGIIDRVDANGRKIIWAGPPICKLTDGNDNLLYFKSDGNDPAIFDKLDDGSTSINRSSPFNLLRGNSIPLYTGSGEPYTGMEFKIKMLVENYTATKRIQLAPNRHITLTFTTAGATDADGYPYSGRRGSQATVLRGFSDNTNFVEFFAKDNNNKKTQVFITNLTLDGNKNNVTSADNTRVLNLNGGNAMCVTLGQNAILQNADNSKGTNGGAGVYVYQALLTMAGGTIRNCSAPIGGAVVIESRNKDVVGFVFKAGNIIDCKATKQGGGVYVRAQSGGVSNFTMEGGAISRCSAAKGGGVFVDDKCSMYMSGGSVVNCKADEQGGGVAIGGASSQLYFSGKVNVSGNTCTASLAPNQACNVELSQDSNAVINTNNGGLFAGSYIGVYVPDGLNLYDAHGIEKKPFGMFADGDNTTNLYSFVNDRNGLKGGLIENPSPNIIYWVQIFSLQVSKEIEASNSIELDPNEEFGFTVNIRGTASARGQKDAKDIDSLRDNYGEMEFTSNGIDTATATFTLKAGETKTAINLSAGLDYEVIETLTDDQKKRYVALPGDVIARAQGIGENRNRKDVDPYTSVVTFTNLAPTCKITDTDNKLLYKKYTVDSKDYYVPAVYKELAGEGSAFAEVYNGALYQSDSEHPTTYSVENGVRVQMLVPDYTLTGVSTVQGKARATLTTASPTDSQFPYQGTNAASIIRRGDHDASSLFTVVGSGDLTLASVVLDGSKVVYAAEEADGGIVKVGEHGKLTIQDGVVLQNSKASRGGAVYVADGGIATMTGGSILKNEAGEGAGFYLEPGSKLNLSGNVNFGGAGVDVGGNIVNRDGNMAGSLTAMRNGGKAYERARQDIYTVESTEAPASIVLADSLMGDAGSIWVWAESENHYVTMKPFATIQEGKTVSGATYGKFRNARPDSETLCAGDTFLSGSSGEQALYVYWSGGFDFQFDKIDGYGAPLSGATFTLFTDADCTDPVQRGGAYAAATSDSEGVVLFEQIPSGIYYMKETGVPTEYVNESVYVVLIGDGALQSAGDGVLANITQSDIAAQVGTGADEKDAAIFLLGNGRATTTPDIARYGIMNVSAHENQVILRKIDGAFEPLKGARFDILRYDRTLVASGTVSQDNGTIWVGSLPHGTYYLHETDYPSGTRKNGSAGWWYTVTVSADKVTCSAKSPDAP